MGSFGSAVVCAILVLINMVVPNLATDYTVGDSSGWTMGFDYSTWTSGKTFKIGDSLVFNYGGGHTVDEVSASDYKTCTVGNAINSDSSGATTIELKTAGTKHYICGVVGHCGSGMKIAIPVKAAASGSGTTPASTSPAGTTTTTTTHQPSSNNTPDSASATLSPFMGIVATWVAFCVMVLSL